MTTVKKDSNLNYIQSFQSIDIDKRVQECVKIRKKYPGRIPIIIDRKDKISPTISKNKYITPCDITIGEFICIIRKQIKLASSDALYFSINNNLPVMTDTIGQVYEKEKNKDGFLYMEYFIESTFG